MMEQIERPGGANSRPNKKTCSRDPNIKGSKDKSKKKQSPKGVLYRTIAERSRSLLVKHYCGLFMARAGAKVLLCTLLRLFFFRKGLPVVRPRYLEICHHAIIQALPNTPEGQYFKKKWYKDGKPTRSYYRVVEQISARKKEFSKDRPAEPDRFGEVCFTRFQPASNGTEGEWRENIWELSPAAVDILFDELGDVAFLTSLLEGRGPSKKEQKEREERERRGRETPGRDRRYEREPAWLREEHRRQSREEERKAFEEARQAAKRAIDERRKLEEEEKRKKEREERERLASDIVERFDRQSSKAVETPPFFGEPSATFDTLQAKPVLPEVAKKEDPPYPPSYPQDEKERCYPAPEAVEQQRSSGQASTASLPSIEDLEHHGQRLCRSLEGVAPNQKTCHSADSAPSASLDAREGEQLDIEEAIKKNAALPELEGAALSLLKKIREGRAGTKPAISTPKKEAANKASWQNYARRGGPWRGGGDE